MIDSRSIPGDAPRAGRPRRGPAIAIAAAIAATTGAGAMGPDLGQVVSRLPASVEFVAAMDDGATLRRTLGDSPLVLALGSMPKPAAVIDAWSQLAADLGMSDAEAFDLLLGRRVVFAASGLQAGAAEPQWALLSELDPLTDRRLRADLGAVPRRYVGDQPILELEHGSFLLATSAGRLRCLDDGRFESTPASTIMLLAPADDRELFETMLPLLHCRTPPRTLSETAGGAAATAMVARDGVFLWRLPDTKLAPDRFIVGTVGFANGRWDMHALAGPPGGWLPETRLDGLEPWSPRMLARLPPDASLAVIGLRPMVREAQEWIAPLLSPDMPETGLDEIESLLGDRSLLALWTPESPAAARAGAEVLIATEVKDLDSLAERNAVALRPSLLQRQGEFEVWTKQRPSLEDLAAEEHATAPSRAAAPPVSAVHWSYVTERRTGEARRGWFVVHVDPTGQAGRTAPSAVREDQEPSSAPPAPTRRYLHVGHAHPRRLAARADVGLPESSQGTPASVLSALLSRVHELDWSVWLDETGAMLEADLSLRIAEPGPSPQ